MELNIKTSLSGYDKKATETYILEQKNSYEKEIQTLREDAAKLSEAVKGLQQMREANMEESSSTISNLKSVNDLLGHEEGDKYIKTASKLICRTFTHSPVFRIGGDEFVAFLEGEDFENRESLFDSFNRKVDSNARNFGVVVSAGIRAFDPKEDLSYDEMFEKADREMYNRKMELKKADDVL